MLSSSGGVCSCGLNVLYLIKVEQTTWTFLVLTMFKNCPDARELRPPDAPLGPVQWEGRAA